MSDIAAKEKRLIKNTFWFAFGTLLSKIITFLIVPFYTAILTTEEYGISDVIVTTVSLAFPFFTLIITEAVFRFALDKKGNGKDIFNIGLKIILIGSVFVTVISYTVFYFIPLIKDFWHLFIIYYVVSSLSVLESEYLKGEEKVVTLSIVNIIHTLIFVVTNVLFLLVLKISIRGYLLAFIVSDFVSCVLYFVLGKLYKIASIKNNEDHELKRQMLSYSAPMIPNSAMWWVTNSSDRYMVSFMISASANGILSIAYKIPSMLSIAISVFMSAWQISVIDDFDNEKGKSFFKTVYQKYNEALLIIAAILIVSSKFLGKYLYSADFFPAWRLSTLLIVGFLFHSLAGFLGTVFTTVKKTRMLLYSTAAGAAINIVLNLLLIYFLGTVGAVIATFASYFLTYLIRRIAIMKYTHIRMPKIKNLLSHLLLFSCAILMYVDLKYTQLIALGTAFAICCLNYKFFGYFIIKIKSFIKRGKK